MKRLPSSLQSCCLVSLFLLCNCSGDDDSDNTLTSESANAGSGRAGGGATNGTAGANAGSGVNTGAPASVPATTTVTGPVAGGKGTIYTATAFDLEANGYTEKEFFLEAAASSYTVDGAMAVDGKWKLNPKDKAAFKTRLLVRRPKDDSKFNGTVLVEWLNVSGGVDADPGFMYNAEMLMREGFAYVGVSAQSTGVEGGGFSLASIGGGGSGGPQIVALKMFDPDRYGSLKHPGDSYSYNIFSIAGQVLRNRQGADALEGLKPQRLIAYGESQSAGRMVSYVNGEHPISKVYDAFFIHSRGASGAAITDSGLGLPIDFGGAAVHIRDDINEKVFQFQTETDVTGMLAFLPARQPDTDKLRTWEVAGTAHADKYLVDFNKTNPAGMVNCPNANAGPQYRIIRAALHSLNLWITDGTAPPHGALLEANSSGQSVRDANGNALGGIRSPDVDVPIATLSGDASLDGGGDIWCFIFGNTTPFTPEKLKMLYPTHEDYVRKVKESAAVTRAAGFLLDPEEAAFVADATKAAVPPQ